MYHLLLLPPLAKTAQEHHPATTRGTHLSWRLLAAARRGEHGAGIRADGLCFEGYARGIHRRIMSEDLSRVRTDERRSLTGDGREKAEDERRTREKAGEVGELSLGDLGIRCVVGILQDLLQSLVPCQFAGIVASCAGVVGVVVSLSPLFASLLGVVDAPTDHVICTPKSPAGWRIGEPQRPTAHWRSGGGNQAQHRHLRPQSQDSADRHPRQASGRRADGRAFTLTKRAFVRKQRRQERGILPFLPRLLLVSHDCL